MVEPTKEHRQSIIALHDRAWDRIEIARELKIPVGVVGDVIEEHIDREAEGRS